MRKLLFGPAPATSALAASALVSWALAVSALVSSALALWVAAPAGASTSARGCPDREPSFPLVSGRLGASDQLVAPGPSRLLLCRYASLNGPGPRLGLLISALITDRSALGSIAAEMDSLPSGPSGPVACPADDASEILAVFGYPGGPADPVTVSLTGCNSATNGRSARMATRNLIARLKGLTPIPPLGRVLGRVRVCGGPAPGGCRVASFTDCTAGRGCATTDAVRVLGRDGQTLVTVPVQKGRFQLRLAPGRYRLKLLEDGRSVHGHVVQTATVTVTAGRTTPVTFGISVP